MSVIARKPASSPARGPADPRYFDENDLTAELKRAFQICHECRMCVGYCGSFPALFDRVDRDIEAGRAEGAEALSQADIHAITDECWQCKLCYIKCPYTPDEQAAEELDLPRLFARERAVRARKDGVPLVDQLLGEPQFVGAVGSGAIAGVSNFVMKSQLLRKVQQRVTGISAEFPLPPFARHTFTSWMRQHPPKPDPIGEVVLFATCYGEFNTPSIARAAVRVLEHNGYRVHYPGLDRFTDEPLSCCGLPNIDGGDVEAATAKIRHNVEILHRNVAQGRKVIVLGPSCGYMMKKEWPEYLPTRHTEEVAAATLDMMEFLVVLGKEKRLNRDFKTGLGTVAYHAACHLRAQKIGFPGQRVLNVVPDTEVRMVEHCSAVDGTWGMKARHYQTGRRYAGKLVRGVDDAGPDLVISDCTLAGLRIAHENQKPVLHPVEALARAYGLQEDT